VISPRADRRLEAITGPTAALWQHLATVPALRAVLLEVTYPNALA
jgi:hypothetical protein